MVVPRQLQNGSLQTVGLVAVAADSEVVAISIDRIGRIHHKRRNPSTHPANHILPSQKSTRHSADRERSQTQKPTNPPRCLRVHKVCVSECVCGKDVGRLETDRIWRFVAAASSLKSQTPVCQLQFPDWSWVGPNLPLLLETGRSLVHSRGRRLWRHSFMTITRVTLFLSLFLSLNLSHHRFSHTRH